MRGLGSLGLGRVTNMLPVFGIRNKPRAAITGISRHPGNDVSKTMPGARCHLPEKFPFLPPLIEHP